MDRGTDVTHMLPEVGHAMSVCRLAAGLFPEG
jgi:hypothetical protein